MCVLGSGALLHSLIGRDLIDEYLLLIHPIVLGAGLRLFPETAHSPLKLIDSTTTTTGRADRDLPAGPLRGDGSGHVRSDVLELDAELLLEDDELLSAELEASGLDISVLSAEALSSRLCGRCVELKLSDAELECAALAGAGSALSPMEPPSPPRR